MKRANIFEIALVAICAIFLVSAPSKAAMLQKGDLIKGDGSAVYYFTGEKRLVFPNDKTYFSWYADFSNIKTVSPAELAGIMIGGNVTYRPGKYLVKITTDPKVYAVDANGTLRWVETEGVAVALYGNDWAKQVRDIPDAFFVNYAIGASIAKNADFVPATILAANPTIVSGAPIAEAPPVAPAQSNNVCSVPAAAQADSIKNPTTVVGIGTPASCTAAAFESAVQKGGVITFNCGADPVTIVVDHQIKLKNSAGPMKNGYRVIDGGGLVTLSGGNHNRILYQDACEEDLGWLNDHCNSSLYPRLVVQNITFANGKTSDVKIGGAAIYLNGGSLKIVNSKFYNNHIVASGADVAGGAVYATLLYGPTYIAGSTFGGSVEQGNSGASGGAIGGIFTSYNIFNSVFNHNKAVGSRSTQSGNGGAVYDDGNSYDLNVCGTTMSENSAGFLGGAIFYVANDVKGHISIDRSAFSQNPDIADAPSPGILKNGAYLQTTVSNITITSSTFN
jgi:hypothetical protein